MGGPEALVRALQAEDRRLRDLIARFSTAACERRGASDLPSCKEALADIAFWDGCAVRVFRDRLAGLRTAPSPEAVARLNREELRRARSEPFDEVLRAYVEATGDLIEFLQCCWDSLKPKYRREFALPLQHRRLHRGLLEDLLDEIGGGAAA